MYPEDKKIDLSNMNILIADDQESLTGTLERVIKNIWGCTIKCVYNGDSVLTELNNGYMGKPYDVLITDMIMPGISGLELIRKSLEIHPGLAILAMTAYKDDFSFLDVFKAGAHDILLKPFSKDELQAKLYRVLREIHFIQSCRSAERRYRGLFNLYADGILILYPANGVIKESNHALTELLGYKEGELEGECFYKVLTEQENTRFKKWYEVFLVEGTGTLSDVQVIKRDGTIIHCDISGARVITDLDDNVFLILKDITERKKMEDDLIEVAQKDELTGLFNKRSFEMQIEWAVKNAEESYSNYALLMIDVDNFKECNDTYGHTVGDQVLSNLGKIIARCIRGSDSGFRFGGDEFAVILSGTDSSISIKVAERIQKQFAKTETFGTSLSIGIAQFKIGMSVGEFVFLADRALYDAKNHGKNAVFCINPQDKVELLPEILSKTDN
ncbi:MAG: diguanylate cyclase [Candidatus Hydrogenedens sp.]